MSFQGDLAEQRQQVALSLIDEVIALKQSRDKLLEVCRDAEEVLRHIGDTLKSGGTLDKSSIVLGNNKRYWNVCKIIANRTQAAIAEAEG